MKRLTLGLKIDSSHIALVFLEQGAQSGPLRTFHLIEKPEYQDFEIFDHATIDRIEAQILEAEKKAGVRLSQIYFCFPQDRVKKVSGSSRRIIHPKHAAAVSVTDIKKSVEQARLLSVDWSLAGLHSFPVGFKVDAKTFTEPPIGVHGRRLEVEVVFFACTQEVLLDVNRFFDRLGRNYTKLILNPLAEASGLAETRLGAGNFIILNFGRTGIELSCFCNFVLDDVATFSGAGEAVDEHLSQKLSIPTSLCEEIKVTYGSLCDEDLRDELSFTVKRVSSYREIKKAALNEELTASYRRILADAKAHLEQVGALRRSDFIIPLGGGAQIRGFDRLIESVFDLPVRTIDTYLPDDLEDKTRFLGAFGALRFESSRCNIENSYKFPRTFLRRIKNLFEEYF
ncbi:cell division FtsA domain-containing protein [Candidatus Omnitrophota bacterium]